MTQRRGTWHSNYQDSFKKSHVVDKALEFIPSPNMCRRVKNPIERLNYYGYVAHNYVYMAKVTQGVVSPHIMRTKLAMYIDRNPSMGKWLHSMQTKLRIWFHF